MAESASFHQAYQTYWRTVVGRLRRHGLSADDSLDLAQEVFLRLYKMWPRYEERGRLAALLGTITHGVRVDFLRTLRPSEDDATEPTAPEAAHPERRLMAAERRDLLERCLRRLSPRQQQVVACKLRGETGPDIAVLLRLAEGSVKTHFFRAQESLKDCIKDLDWQEGNNG